MSEETTTEQLAEIEGQATEYTPPNGWRVLQVGERLRDGDVTVRRDGYQYPTERVGGWVGSNQRYIRPIEPEPQPEPQPEPVQVPEPQAADTAATEYTPPEGWRLLAVGELVMLDDQWVRQDGSVWRSMGTEGPVSEGARYIRRIEPEPEHNNLVRDVTHLLQESGVLDSAKSERQIEELRCEVSYVQRLLGESRQRVAQLEELVGSLRTINEAQEKTVRLSGQENTDLQHRLSVVADQWALQAGEISGLQTQLDAVKAEVVQQRLERNRYQNQVLRLTAELDSKTTECRNLQIELDALQQAPQAETVAAGPTPTEDRYEEAWDAGTARAVETIAEWLEPIKGAIDAADNQDELARAGFFAIDTIRHLPAIMRTLTGLTPED